MQSRLEYLQISTVDKEVVLRLEAKIGDLETRLDLEQATRQRAEVKKIQILIHQVELLIRCVYTH